MSKLEEIKKEYAEQDNRGTAYPIYVTVQELICIGVMADGYSPPGDDSVCQTEYRINGDGEPDVCLSREQAIDLIKEDHELSPKEIEEAIENIEELNVGYMWFDVEVFLTIKGAEEYMKANSHNHGKLRTYVKHFERRNFEMRTLLKEIGFKSEE